MGLQLAVSSSDFISTRSNAYPYNIMLACETVLARTDVDENGRRV